MSGNVCIPENSTGSTSTGYSNTGYSNTGSTYQHTKTCPQFSTYVAIDDQCVCWSGYKV